MGECSSKMRTKRHLSGDAQQETKQGTVHSSRYRVNERKTVKEFPIFGD